MGPLRGHKRDLYEGGIRVPLIVRWPGHTPAGTESTHVAYFGDLFATAAQLAGLTPPSGLDSISFLPSVDPSRGPQAEHEFLYWEFHERGSAQAVRFGNWKGVIQPMGSRHVELYDLAADLGETHDLAAAHPEIVEQILSNRQEGAHAVAVVARSRPQCPTAATGANKEFVTWRSSSATRDLSHLLPLPSLRLRRRKNRPRAIPNRCPSV